LTEELLRLWTVRMTRERQVLFSGVPAREQLGALKEVASSTRQVGDDL
jgi:hypothetical protein